jgi:hypothetical protein
MVGYIIDPEIMAIVQIELSDAEGEQMVSITNLLGCNTYRMSFLETDAYKTCTAYWVNPAQASVFFRIKGFQRGVKFGKTVVVDKTSTGFPKSHKVTLPEITSLITFFPKKVKLLILSDLFSFA